MVDKELVKKVKEVQHFFYTQAFADGLRATFAILIPALAGIYFNQFELGTTVSLGAMCISITDAPGPYIHKRNGMIICAGFLFLTALITSIARFNIYFLGLEIALVCFFFSMFNVYGNRAAGIGNAAILMMILTMDRIIKPEQVFSHSLLILGGALFYTTLSLLLFKIRPYRSIQRALGNCIREMADYLSSKSDFYNPNTDLTLDYQRVVSKQIIVHEKQNFVRELLFKTRAIVQESTHTGRRLLLTFVETVDLFESITASYYDYKFLREKYQGKGILEIIEPSLKKMAAELDGIGKAIEANLVFTRSFDYDEEVRYLKEQIDILEREGENTRLLKRILVNIRTILISFNRIQGYFENKEFIRTGVDHSRFISQQEINPKQIWQNLTLKSSVFRHALRVSIACLLAYIIAKVIGYGHHSYWILLTVAFILKPAFSLTKSRNIQRITGTLIGGAIGVLILLLIKDSKAQFIFMVVFMIGTYSFMRINYLAMVVCTTPYVLILFKFFGLTAMNVASERLLDTIIGCAIAFPASYLLFPSWEAGKLREFMKAMLKANSAYLEKVLCILIGKELSITDYKVARKEVYVASANLSSAFQRMVSEPKNKQSDQKVVHEFVVLNHILFSSIASIASTILTQQQKLYSEELVRIGRRAYERLQNALSKYSELDRPNKFTSTGLPKELQPGEGLLKEQLEFIEKLSLDIQKNTGKLFQEPEQS
jgi:uncharacterized membrane protein (TIGR01666 family)